MSIWLKIRWLVFRPVFTLPSDCQGKHGVPVWAGDDSSVWAGGDSSVWAIDDSSVRAVDDCSGMCWRRVLGLRIPLSGSQLFWSHTGFGLGMT